MFGSATMAADNNGPETTSCGFFSPPVRFEESLCNTPLLATMSCTFRRRSIGRRRGGEEKEEAVFGRRREDWSYICSSSKLPLQGWSAQNGSCATDVPLWHCMVCTVHSSALVAYARKGNKANRVPPTRFLLLLYIR